MSVSSASRFSSVTEDECLCLKKECAIPWAGCAQLACLLLSNHHCYRTMQRRTQIKERRAEFPLKASQVYTKQPKTTSMLTSKSFENFRRHFLKINHRYNVRFLTSATIDTDCVCICIHTSVKSMLSHLYVWSVSLRQLQSVNASLMCQMSLHAHQLIGKTGCLQVNPASVWSCISACKGGGTNDVGHLLKSTPSGTAQT